MGFFYKNAKNGAKTKISKRKEDPFINPLRKGLVKVVTLLIYIELIMDCSFFVVSKSSLNRCILRIQYAIFFSEKRIRFKKIFNFYYENMNRKEDKKNCMKKLNFSDFFRKIDVTILFLFLQN